MFDEEQLNEFVNRMFDNATNTNSSVKEGLSNFRKYLKETKMCEESYLKRLDKIIECSSEILALKAKLGNIDITTLIPQDEKPSVKAPQKTLGTMPRTSATRKRQTSNIYGGSTPSYSSSCSSSTPSYSNSCGGGSSYTSRC